MAIKIKSFTLSFHSNTPLFTLNLARQMEGFGNHLDPSNPSGRESTESVCKGKAKLKGDCAHLSRPIRFVTSSIRLPICLVVPGVTLAA